MNKNKKIKSDKIRLAKLKYFDVEHNGVEVTREDPYVFLVKVNDSYINLFDPLEEMPVYDRLPYSNVARTVGDYGTKIRLIQGEEKEGLCYVIENVDIGNLLGKDVIKVSDLINYMYRSEDLFVDRKELLVNDSRLRGNKKLKAIYYGDCNRMDDFIHFVNDHNKGFTYKKID